MTPLWRQAWIVVGLLWVVAVLNYLDRLMITTMRDPIVAELELTDAQFGLLTSVFLWIYGALSPLGGFLADRFSRRAVILVSLAVWSAVTWLTGHVHSFEGMITARALMGVSEACYIPAALALIADYHRGRTRSLAIGLHMSGVYAGAALGGVGGYLAERAGWRFGFTLFGAVGVVYAVVLALCLRDAPAAATPAARADQMDRVDRVDRVEAPPPMDAGAAIRALFHQPGFRILFALNALVGVANWGINGWLPTYLREHFQLGLGEAGLSATGYIQAASFVGVLVGGAWADHWARQNPRGRSLVPAIGFCVAAPCLYLAATTDVLVSALLGLIVFGLGRGFFDANHMPILRQVAAERFSATGYGVLNFVSCAAGGLMIYAGGRMKDAHVDLGTVFQWSAAGMFLVGLLLFAVKPRPSL